MKFEEALYKFNLEIIAEYGIEGITKIGLDPELFSRVMIDLHRDGAGKYSNFRVESMGEFKINGIQLLARRKDDF